MSLRIGNQNDPTNAVLCPITIKVIIMFSVDIRAKMMRKEIWNSNEYVYSNIKVYYTLSMMYVEWNLMDSIGLWICGFSQNQLLFTYNIVKT